MARPKEFDTEEVLDRAMEMFWKKGYHATSMSELLDYMGMNRASFYAYFKNKEALYKTVLERYQNWQGELIQKIVENQASPLQVIREIFLHAVQESTQDEDRKGCFVVNSTVEFANQDEKILNHLVKNEQDMESFFEQLILKAQEKNEISTDQEPKVLATYLFSSLQGIRVITKTNRNQHVLNQVVGAIIRNL